MHTRILHIFRTLLFVAILLISSCAVSSHDEQRVLSVSIQPQRYIVEQIVGDKFSVNCLVPAGSNPEAYDPTPMQLVELDKSVAYMRVGGMLGFELSWLERFSQNNPDMKIYDTSCGVEPLIASHHHSHGDGIEHTVTGIDPHIWSSPRNVRIMAHNICNALVDIDTPNASYYKSNCDRFIQHIDSIETIVAQLLEPYKGSAFAIYHPSLSYFARDYGLKQLCLEHMGKENSVLTLKNTVDEARQNGVKVVFVQQEFNPRQVETFARELGADVVMINPLNYDWDSEIIDIAHAIAR